MNKTAGLSVLGLLIAAWAGASTATDLYRCAVKDGPAIYSDHPCGKDAVIVGNVPERSKESVPAHDGDDVNVNVEVNNNIQIPYQPGYSPHEVRGLPFEIYRRLDRGMSEGEVLAVAGSPERETIDSFNTYTGMQKKSYYYFTEGRNANVTRIRFLNGTVFDIDRNLAPY